MKPEEILKGYIENRTTGQDNLLRAAIGQLTADRTKELSESIQAFQKQLPITISELRQTISQNTDKMIKSNERLSKSNESHAKWMKWLTFGLIIVGAAQIITTYLINR